MPRITHASDAILTDLKPEMDMLEAVMGYVPNSMKVLARNPAMLRGFMVFTGSIMGPGAKLEPGLRQMIANISSQASGCTYCQAHTAHGAARAGMDEAKIEALWSYETSDLFSDAECAALRLAQAGGSVPNEATDEMFVALKAHYSEDEITEIVVVIALFGFLNRLNDTLATPLEEQPLDFANVHLTGLGWTIGEHGGD